ALTGPGFPWGQGRGCQIADSSSVPSSFRKVAPKGSPEGPESNAGHYSAVARTIPVESIAAPYPHRQGEKQDPRLPGGQDPVDTPLRTDAVTHVVKTISTVTRRTPGRSPNGGIELRDRSNGALWGVQRRTKRL